MKSAITQPKKVQIPKFWCLKSCTNIWVPFGIIHSIQKINKIDKEGKKGSKFAKIGQFLHCKKLKLQYLKNFPRFDFMGFFCDFLHMRPLIFHWKSSWYRTGVMGGMHGWREYHSPGAPESKICIYLMVIDLFFSPCVWSQWECSEKIKADLSQNWDRLRDRRDTNLLTRLISVLRSPSSKQRLGWAGRPLFTS